MPCVVLKCLFKSTTNFRSGQCVHWMRRCAFVLCDTNASNVSNSSRHIRILHVNNDWFFGRPRAVFLYNNKYNLVFLIQKISVQNAYFDFEFFLFSFLTGTFLIGSTLMEGSSSVFISGGFMISSGTVSLMGKSKRKLHAIRYKYLTVVFSWNEIDYQLNCDPIHLYHFEMVTNHHHWMSVHLLNYAHQFRF